MPPQLKEKRLISLNMASLVAGTKYRGEFEERLRDLLAEIRRSGDVILFVDEMHTIVGAGSTQGSLDTANILKPALARGELQTIGATTFEEYRREIERDSALERRFQRVVVEQPTPEETLGILQQIAPAYERHHRVRYTEEALKACVTLTDRYMSDRSFPDKAIDLMDEAGSRAHLQRSGASVADERLKALEEARYEEATALRIEELRQRAALDETTEIGVSEVERLMTELTGIPLERITGTPVKEMWLFALGKGKAYPVPRQ